MSSEKTEIICAYCGSVWDYAAHETCPYCAATPDLKQIKAARAAAAKRKKQDEEVVTSKNPGVLLSMWVASKLKLWLIILAALVVIPIVISIILAIVPSSAKKINPQVVDNIEITSHSVGEEFKVVEYLTVTVEEPALLFSESSLGVMIPEDHAVLLVKATAKSDGKSHSLYSLRNEEYAEIYETPYLIVNDTAYQAVSVTSFSNMQLPEPELNALIRLDPGNSIKAEAGYLCYIVPKGTTNCTINFASKHYQDKLQYLDAIHSVALTVEEVSAE